MKLFSGGYRSYTGTYLRTHKCPSCFFEDAETGKSIYYKVGFLQCVKRDLKEIRLFATERIMQPIMAKNAKWNLGERLTIRLFSFLSTM
jgi:hypothetical protein